MKIKDVLVIGAGISGCAVALALAKRGLPVTILTSSLDERIYHAPFIQREQLEEKIRGLQKGVMEQVSCLRATEQLAAFAKISVEELLESHCFVDRNGNIDIHRCLQEQLKQLPEVEWISNHSLLEILTLHQHSMRKADLFKSPMCIGVSIYHRETNSIERILAKEVILATGGVASLYPYSTHPRMARGEGLAIAQRAGARLLKMGHIQFHPLGLFEKEKPCFPLPLELLDEGGELCMTDHSTSEIFPHNGYLIEQLYEELQKNHAEHLWLNLTMLDPAELKEKFPTIDAHCLERGYNIAKDLLPVVPVARYTCGGIAVDRVAQTSLLRLRAVGEAASSGLVYDFQDEAMGVLESLSWAVACADDVAKQLSKYIYYFPDVQECMITFQNEADSVQEDWQLLRQIMWNYVGIKRDRERLKRGCALLEQLQHFNEIDFNVPRSIDRIHLGNAIQAALLIAKDALWYTTDSFYNQSRIEKFKSELARCQS